MNYIGTSTVLSNPHVPEFPETIRNEGTSIWLPTVPPTESHCEQPVGASDAAGIAENIGYRKRQRFRKRALGVASDDMRSLGRSLWRCVRRGRLKTTESK